MLFGICRIIAVVSFLYLVWRNLRGDYKEEQLIVYSWWVLFLVLIVGRISFGIEHWGVWNESWTDWLRFGQKPGFSYFGGLIGLMVATIWHSKKNEWKLWAFMESITGIIYLTLFWLALTERNWIYVGVMPFGLVLSWWISGKYRSFVWYKSGKKGFVFFFVNAVVGLLLALASWWLKDGPIVIFGYLGLSLISAVRLVILGNE